MGLIRNCIQELLAPSEDTLEYLRQEEEKDANKAWEENFKRQFPPLTPEERERLYNPDPDEVERRRAKEEEEARKREEEARKREEQRAYQARIDYLERLRQEAVEKVDLEEACAAERERRKMNPQGASPEKLMKQYYDEALWTAADSQAFRYYHENKGDLNIIGPEVDRRRRELLKKAGYEELEARYANEKNLHYTPVPEDDQSPIVIPQDDKPAIIIPR